MGSGRQRTLINVMHRKSREIQENKEAVHTSETGGKMDRNHGKMALLSIWVFTMLATSLIAAGKPFTHRFVYANIGMQRRVIDTCIGRMKAAASLGYNGYIVINHEDNHLENVSQDYLNNVNRTVAEAKKLNMALIPRHFNNYDVGYEDFNLSEAFPVRNTKFVVANGEARAVSDHGAGFMNGDFETFTGNKPDGWQLVSMPNATIDKNGPKSGQACLRISGGGKFARIKQRVALKPFRAYRLSVWVRTKDFRNWKSALFLVNGGALLNRGSRPFGTPLDEVNRGIWTTLSVTHGWRLSQCDFNSQNNTSATIEFVVSSARGNQVGTLWLDDMRMEEVGLFETVRTRTRPITVRSADGSTTYKEGTDYVVDPKCNSFTVESFWYEGHLKIPQGSPIQNGQELRVDWYQMADVAGVYPEGNYCIGETWDALRKNVMQMDSIYQQNKWMFLGMSEWRTAFWDDQCELYPKARTAGEYMAEMLRTTHNLIWETSPGRELYMWNDMYDPYHNAWKPYGMTNGGCLETWKNMDTNIVIMNWNACGLPWYEMSVRFYMGIDDSLNPEGKVYRQILSVMDAGRVGTWMNVVDKAEKEGGRGVIGISYVDWFANYSQMRAVRDACIARGRWDTGPLPPPALKENHPQNPVPIVSPQLTLSPKTNRQFEIQYRTSQNARVKLHVVDLQGRSVAVIGDGKRTAGSHTVLWDATGLSSGVYFLRLAINGIAGKALRHVLL